MIYIVPPEFTYVGQQGVTGLSGGDTGIQGFTGLQGGGGTGIAGPTGILGPVGVK